MDLNLSLFFLYVFKKHLIPFSMVLFQSISVFFYSSCSISLIEILVFCLFYLLSFCNVMPSHKQTHAYKQSNPIQGAFDVLKNLFSGRG